MGKPLNFRHRRRVGIAITLLAVMLTECIVRIEDSQLASTSFLTGGTLLGSIIVLILFGARRRLPSLPFGNASVWMQVHLYTGLFAAAVYLMHVPAVVGSGTFEAGLSIVFLLVTASGCYGWYASRSIPRRLSAVEGQPRFDQVPWHREQIAHAANELLLQMQEPASVTVLGGYYGRALRPFFVTRPSLAYVMSPGGSRRRRLLHGLRELNRYMGEEGQRVAGRYAALVRRRDDLDYQYAMQFRLRLWVVVHSVFSFALLAGGVIHAALAWRFSP